MNERAADGNVNKGKVDPLKPCGFMKDREYRRSFEGVPCLARKRTQKEGRDDCKFSR